MEEKTPFGIVGGSSLLKSEIMSSLTKFVVETDHGPVTLYKSQGKGEHHFVFCQRHGTTSSYVVPSSIPFVAIAAAFKKLGIEKVIAFGSTGSMKPTISIGSIVIPDDIFSVWNLISAFTSDMRAHIVPQFDLPLRSKVIELLKANSISPLLEEGVYVQTIGPRFESKAEIRFLSTVGDIVGMTCANELTVFQEQGIAYALICMVDNMANGIKELTLEKFHEGVRSNQVTVDKILNLVIDNFCK